MVDPHFFCEKDLPIRGFCFSPKKFQLSIDEKNGLDINILAPKDGWMRNDCWVGWKKMLDEERLTNFNLSTKRTSHFLGPLKKVCWNRQKSLPALTRPKEWTSCLSTTSFCVRDAGRGLKLGPKCFWWFVGWNRSYLELGFCIMYIYYTYIYICTCIINVYHVFICTSPHMSYTYICFQPASHGDMTSSMVLKSPARPVLDGPVPPWRLGSNSGYVTDRWMWKKPWDPYTER